MLRQYGSSYSFTKYTDGVKFDPGMTPARLGVRQPLMELFLGFLSKTYLFLSEKYATVVRTGK